MTLTRKAALGVAACAAVFSGTFGTANAAGDLFGAIAVADLGDSWQFGAAWDTSDQGRADASALDQCGYTNCVVKLRWVNGCGTVARRDDNLVFATGRNQAEAERNAMSQLGADPNPLLVSLGSAEPSYAKIVRTHCTANAG
ncbi:DUF4189 domain-containing protein [Nocardia sp. ET3-3]|uniref:DUF4189 domain-containing protein n=1 Tax=Nocardia terrae TaxID=2675851 RepID=A0A7K1UNW7_9NOCA|nr:DUF4189 domain-containing protein [Nocardia terrae]MVU76026.1 DUF4189 domain-containing protein [Nocardia terrae]